jgi:hypothetical protein
MKNWKIINRVILCLMLSLTAMNVCADCWNVYDPGNPTSTGSSQIQLCTEPQEGGDQTEVCAYQGSTGELIIDTEGPPCGLYIHNMPLTDASYLLVFLLGIYGIYIYRKRVAVKWR